MVGKIVGWWPAEGDDPALWHVQHSDGDEEDLEEHEVLECLVPLGLARNDSASSHLDNKASPGDGDEGKTDKQRSTPRGDDAMDVVEIVESTDANDMDVDEGEDEGADDQEDMEDEPDIVKSFPLWRRHYTQVKETNIGLAGLQQEILVAYKRLADSLKRLKSDAAKASRRLWEESVKNSFSIVELKSALAELEEMVHQLQVEDDVTDEDEYKRNHEEKVAEMVEEGWKFDSTAAINGTEENALFDPSAPQDFINRRGRRFFVGHGKSDGVIVAYLPPEKNEGMALWHMEHDDGDAEDIDESDVEKALRHFLQDAIEDDASSELGEDEDGLEEEETDEDDMDVETEAESQSKTKGHKNGFNLQLWPTVGVRCKWSKSLELSKTVGEGRVYFIVL